jgi:hypothetical protein
MRHVQRPVTEVNRTTNARPFRTNCCAWVPRRAALERSVPGAASVAAPQRRGVLHEFLFGDRLGLSAAIVTKDTRLPRAVDERSGRDARAKRAPRASGLGRTNASHSLGLDREHGTGPFSRKRGHWTRKSLPSRTLKMPRPPTEAASARSILRPLPAWCTPRDAISPTAAARRSLRSR